MEKSKKNKIFSTTVKSTGHKYGIGTEFKAKIKPECYAVITMYGKTKTFNWLTFVEHFGEWKTT